MAYLSVHTHDLASAEGAFSNALVPALAHWPKDLVPQNPEACLMTAARNALIDAIRDQRVVLESEHTLKLLTEDPTEATLPTSTQFPEERLKLLFVCAHPGIDPAMHTPLMLQNRLGPGRSMHWPSLSQSAPKTMGQRRVRAKTKIRSGGIPFEIPQEPDLPDRLDAVLEAIYVAFGIGWEDMAGADQRGRDQSMLLCSTGLLGAFGQKPDQISQVRRPSSISKLSPCAARTASLSAGLR